jgi:hypothetical protein
MLYRFYTLRNIAKALCGLLFLLSVSSCQNFVQGVSKPINTINDDDLNNESQLPVLFAGVTGNFGQYWRFASMYLSTLSDEFITVEGIAQNPVFSSYREFDMGMPLLVRTDREWGFLGGARFQAQDLINRVPKIHFSQDSNRLKCLFVGYFYIALVQHHYAAFWGISPRQGGGVLLGGPFIPSSQMHDTALNNFNRALQYARTDYERRLVNSFVVRIHLLEGRYKECLTAARLGMREGDAPMSQLYSPTSANFWYDDAGVNHRIIPADRFRGYVEAEPAEAGRIPLSLGNAPAANRTTPYYVQAKYDADVSPIDLITWQENALMIAEMLVRDNNATAALVEVNRVRAAAPRVMGVPALALRSTTNLDSIRLERQKQLFATGLRILDQRRFNDWHFPPSLANTAWYYLPISQRERNSNPNLPPN